MQSQRDYFSSSTGMLLSFAFLFLLTACQPAKNTNSNANANANANANSSASTSNANSNAENAGSSINTREPEKYSGTMVLSIETEGGDKAIGIPSLSVQVARNGGDRRIEFKLPDGSPLIYLDHDNRHYVILPARKQYAELSKEATGVELHKLLTPGQLVADLKNKKGVERVGEGPLNGRTAEKYRYAAATNTNTKAGEVKAEAFIYIDKETGLPLRAEMLIESSGDVKGVKAARAVTELRDIKTDIDPSMFQTPAGYEQVAPERVRQQIAALTGAVEAILRAMMTGASGSSPSPSATAKP
jgi:outer membrane lipoprotein-sorting protein